MGSHQIYMSTACHLTHAPCHLPLRLYGPFQGFAHSPKEPGTLRFHDMSSTANHQGKIVDGERVKFTAGTALQTAVHTSSIHALLTARTRV